MKDDRSSLTPIRPQNSTTAPMGLGVLEYFYLTISSRGCRNGINCESSTILGIGTENTMRCGVVGWGGGGKSTVGENVFKGTGENSAQWGREVRSC